MLQRNTLRDAIEAIRFARGRKATRDMLAIEDSELFQPSEARYMLDALPEDYHWQD